jgi:uncharacterized protein
MLFLSIIGGYAMARIMSRWRVLVALLAVFLCGSNGSSTAAEPQILEIMTKGGIRTFMVELAITEDQLKKGLSGRRSLPEGTGMLLDFRTEMQAAMGTKDTLIPLDMIFIRADGRIHKIAEDIEPLSTRQTFSNGPVRAVLEVLGGTARKLGIAVGDRVAHPVFSARR